MPFLLFLKFLHHLSWPLVLWEPHRPQHQHHYSFQLPHSRLCDLPFLGGVQLILHPLLLWVQQSFLSLDWASVCPWPGKALFFAGFLVGISSCSQFTHVECRLMFLGWYPMISKEELFIFRLKMIKDNFAICYVFTDNVLHLLHKVAKGRDGSAKKTSYRMTMVVWRENVSISL